MSKSCTQLNDIRHQQQAIADGFSAAANTYHQHNQLQKLTAAYLLNAMTSKGLILDIGAGPGTDFVSCGGVHSQVIALDIAEGMLKELTNTYPDYQPICADASLLPIASQCIDNVYSNLAMQWCPSLASAIKETHRVLVKNGKCFISLVVDGSLNELQTLGLQINQFLTQDQISTACDLMDWQHLSIKFVPIRLYFKDLKSLLYSLKGIGASTPVVNDEPATNKVVGLKGRQYWQQLCEQAKILSTCQGIPLTYQIAIIEGQK